MSDQRSELEMLRAEVAELRARLDAAEHAASHDGESPVVPKRTDRRGALRLAAAAATGAVAAAVVPRPVAADDPDDVTLGQVKSTAARPTGSRYTGTSSGVGALFATGGGASGASAEFSAALGAWSHAADMPNGLYGFSDQDGGTGVVGKNDSGAGGTGVRGVGRNVGVFGETRNDDGTDNWGVVGEGRVGVRGDGLLEGVIGVSSLGFAGVRGEGSTGGLFEGSDTGVSAVGDRYAVVANGGLAALHILATGATPPAMQGGPLRAVGEVVVDGLGDLWFCVGSGTPGEWRRLSGAATAGSFHPVGPFRMYDSRLPAYPVSGKLGAGDDRNISVADGRDDTGAIVETDAVPDGATAVSINLTVTETEAPSFLAVTPGDSTSFNSSSINWWDGGLSLANGLIVPLGPKRDLRIFAGPGGATHFLVDVAGYWR